MQKVFKYPANQSPQPTMIGGLLMLVGMLILGFSIPLGILMMIGGLTLISLTNGYIVDLNNDIYSEYYSILYTSPRLKESKALSSIKYIGLVRVTESQKMWMRSISHSTTSMRVKMNFVIGNRKYVHVVSGDRESILNGATQIANCAGLRIYDVSTPEKRWIEPENVK